MVHSYGTGRGEHSLWLFQAIAEMNCVILWVDRPHAVEAIFSQMCILTLFQVSL